MTSLFAATFLLLPLGAPSAAEPVFLQCQVTARVESQTSDRVQTQDWGLWEMARPTPGRAAPSHLASSEHGRALYDFSLDCCCGAELHHDECREPVRGSRLVLLSPGRTALRAHSLHVRGVHAASRRQRDRSRDRVRGACAAPLRQGTGGRWALPRTKELARGSVERPSGRRAQPAEERSDRRSNRVDVPRVARNRADLGSRVSRKVQQPIAADDHAANGLNRTWRHGGTPIGRFSPRRRPKCTTQQLV